MNQNEVNALVKGLSLVKNEVITVKAMVTPDWARAMICDERRYPGQREMKKQVVDNYVRAMRLGQWVPDVSILDFNPKGILMNGYHRCHAIVKYEQPVAMTMRFNVPDEAFVLYDRGCPRKLGDRLRAEGFNEKLADMSSFWCRIINHRNILNDADIQLFTEENEELLMEGLDLARTYHPKSPAIYRLALAGFLGYHRKKAELFAKNYANSIVQCNADGMVGDGVWAFTKFMAPISGRKPDMQSRNNYYKIVYAMKAFANGEVISWDLKEDKEAFRDSFLDAWKNEQEKEVLVEA